MPSIFIFRDSLHIFFFEVQGITETTTIFLGSTPSFSAHQVLYAPPECICGERRGEMRNHFRMIVFEILHPSRATRRKHRKPFSALQTFNKFFRFNHSGNICSKIHVKILSNPSKRYAVYIFRSSPFHTEHQILLNTCPNGGSCLHNHYFVWIGDSFFHLRNMSLFSNSIHRTYYRTLPTINTIHFWIFVVINPSFVFSQKVLKIHTNTFTCLDAFITGNTQLRIEFKLFPFYEWHALLFGEHSDFREYDICQFHLPLTPLPFLTFWAELSMRCEQSSIFFAETFDLWRSRVY